MEERISGQALDQFIKQSLDRNAFLSVKLGRTINALAYPAKIEPNVLKSKVCMAIKEYLKEREEITSWEKRKNQPGAYMAHCVDAVGSWIGKAMKSTKS